VLKDLSTVLTTLITEYKSRHEELNDIKNKQNKINNMKNNSKKH